MGAATDDAAGGGGSFLTEEVSPECPNCGSPRPASEESCAMCGIVFAKYRPRGTGKAEEALVEEDHPFDTHPLGARAWASVGGGAVLALVVLSLPFVDFVFQTFITLVHEFGHALTGWIFGYPSIPAFDFRYGGGVTLHQERSDLLVAAVYLLLAGGVFLYRRNRATVATLCGLTLLYSAVSLTSAHEVVNLFMGHGTELIMSGIFLYRGLSGFAVIRPVERPLYAFLGFFILFSDLRFAWRLYSDPVERYLYEEAKGGGHWMDFSRIAGEYLHVDLRAVALFFFLCCFLPLIAIWAYRARRTSILVFLNHLFDRDPS